jgi:hypothetical protein
LGAVGTIHHAVGKGSPLAQPRTICGRVRPQVLGMSRARW